jgi:glutamine cyclotransferase
MQRVLFFLFALYFLSSCGGSENPPTGAEDNSNPPPPVLSYNIVKVYPHDTSSYTEGLIWYNNELYESAGSYNKSKLFKSDIATAKASNTVKLDDKYFGEGIAILNDKIYQLTYVEHKVFVYDLKTFQKIKEMEWPYEGWGMTTNWQRAYNKYRQQQYLFCKPR